MKEILQRVKEELEKSFDNPKEHNLDECITALRNALPQAQNKEQMIDNIITSVTQARNAQQALMNAGDESSINAYGEAFRALDQAIQSYSESNNDPY